MKQGLNKQFKPIVDDSRKETLKLKEIEEDFAFLLDLDKSDDEEEVAGIKDKAETKDQREKRERKKQMVAIAPESLNALK